MKLLLLLLISSIISLASVGKITSVKGEVYVDRENKQISAKVSSILEIKDQVITKSNSKAMLLFNDNMSITVGNNSTLEVQKYLFDTDVVPNNKATLGFGTGVFRTITGKLGKLNPRGLIIKTNTATIGIRGSDGVTRVYADGSVQHTTYSGVFVLTSNKTGRTVWIPKGTTGRLDKYGMIVLPTTTKELEEDYRFMGITSYSDEIDKNEPFIIPEPEPEPTPPEPFNIETLTQAELDEYLSGDIVTELEDYVTPTTVIDNYISNSSSASYTGNIEGTVQYIEAGTDTLAGTFTLDIDFGSQNFTGSLDLGNFTTTIDNAYTTVTNGGFSTTDTAAFISSSMYGSSALEGKFYGNNAGVTAGTIYLENEANDVFSGNFIGKQ